MITAEAYTRKENKNASEDFVRGAVWAVRTVVGYIVKNRKPTEKEDIEALLRYESVFSDFIEAEKESFEFNRGATWGLQRFIMAPAKDESLNYGDRMTVVGSFTGDYIKSKENALQAYLDFADEYNDQVAIEHLRKEIAWAKQIEANKSNE
ncbi:MAG: hypothetical protein J6O49_19795 [Bacteroidaceae bacterium]|nr:hypothetical protein [Bacteroidaceae bacterium]